MSFKQGSGFIEFHLVFFSILTFLLKTVQLLVKDINTSALSLSRQY
jgi:hypothetical protein